MKDIDSTQCSVHVLVCTNERPPGKACCFKVGGLEFYQKFKNKLKDENLIATHWATRTGCLGHCNDVGTSVVIHRKNAPSKWFTEVTDSDFELIWNTATKG